ncbi:MAG: hypothetical protein ACRDL5_15005, partial [Solirubrobacteraceae bacterium]
WRAAASAAGERLGVPVSVHAAGEHGLLDPRGALGEAYGIADGGAVLVRPDGFVAWRGRDQARANADALASVLATVLARD